MDMWSFFWALIAFFLALAVYFHLKKSSRITNATTSSQPEPSAEQQSSASSSSNTPVSVEYEVFLSFRGPDVRTNFADFLHKYLVHTKIRTFLDDEDLRKGEKMAPSLVKAIKESKVYIPILSPDYASSKWCLQELSQMVKCCKQGNGHIILPIFYMMEPRDVRHQEGYYKKAFRQHMKKFDAETINEWKETLKEVGEMKGWSVKESDRQGAVIDQVFSKVWSHLTRDYMLVTDDLIGIDLHVENMKGLLQLPKYEAVKVIGIHGMGGIGKTTVAKALYNEVCAQFERFCFLEDVRETLAKPDGVVTLQKRIISSILRVDVDIKDANEGINVIRNRICKLKVFVVLDDADDRFKFDEILGKLEDFCLGSRFIITTRDKRVVEFFEEYEIYELGEMDEGHSLELFSRHAFGVNNPPKEYSDLSMKFVKAAAGLPLALKVIGSLLFRKDISFWEAKLEQLKDILPSQVQETLRISYLELTHEERQIFLDICCVFRGEDKESPFYMWSDCGFHPEIAITILIQRSLIKINKQDKKNVFWIHDHTRDLGRTIVCEEDFRCPWKRSRIWSNEDALDMLTYEQGTDRVEVLKVDIEDDNFKLTERQFEKLSGLRYLNVNKGEFTGNFERIIPNLRWLELYGWRWLPDDMNLKKLVILRMSYTALFDDWKGWNSIKVAQKLKSISLVCCRSLRRPPNLSQCQNLEIIHFSGCKRMRGELSIDSLKNLKELYLGWSPITAITGDIGMLQKLQVFNMINLDLRELPAGMCKLSSLELLRIISNDSELKQVPALPASLKWLYLSCPSVPNFLDLKNLQVLEFSSCRPEIPGEIWKLSKLKTLRLYACACKVQLLEDSGNEMSALPSSLSSLELNLCNNLEILPNLSNLINLKEFILVGTNVHEIPGLGGMRMLETLKISHSPHITHLDGLEHFILLKTLSVSCDKLEKLPSLMNLTKLDTLEITHCHLISEIHGLGNLRESLSCLTIKNCPSLAYTEGLGLLKLSATMEQLLPSLSNLGKLRKLILGLDQNDDGHILSREQFLDFSALCNLNILYISSAERLTEVCGFERLELLESLDISHCSEIRKLPNLSGLKKLKKLDILGCMQLSEVMGLENLESLQELRICNCTSIKKLPDLSCLKQLQSLDTSGCTQLTEVTGIEKLKKLKWLNGQEFKVQLYCVLYYKCNIVFSQGTDRLEVLKVEIKDKKFKLTERQFGKLSGLRYLNVKNGEFTGNFEKILPNLCWLVLYGSRWLPVDMNLKKLVILRMSYSPRLVDDWRGWDSIKVAHKLKSVSLVSCQSLRRPPNLSQCQNLEMVHFSVCRRMRGEFSIVNLKNLKELGLICTQISKLTGDTGMLQKLQEFNPLEVKLRELPAGLCRLSSLECLRLTSKDSRLKQLPALPTSLKRLYLSSPSVPNLLDLNNLEELEFYSCHDPEIPGDIWKLSKLKTLKLWVCRCKSLLVDSSENKMSALPVSLRRLVIDCCTTLERLPNLSNLSNLTDLVLTGTSVHEIPGLGEMRMLETLKVSHSPHISNLDGLEQLTLLKTLSIRCEKLEKLPSLMNLTKLDTLEITHCLLISELHGICKLVESLFCLTIINCPSLAYTEGLGSLQLSATMDQLLPSLSNLSKLRKLFLSLNQNDDDHILSREQLFLGLDRNDDDHVLSREQFLDLSSLCNLNMLSITRSARLTEVCGFEILQLLELLYISCCSAIRKLPNLSGLKQLKKLDILECVQLSEVMGLENLESLQELSICNCTLIKTLPDLSCLKQLQRLDTSGCTQLTQVTGIEKLKKLKWLNIQELAIFRPFVS